MLHCLFLQKILKKINKTLEDLVIIIVLNHNKRDDLLECLDSINKLEYKEFEIVIVDNDSTDDSAPAIKKIYPDIHLIESKINLGVAGGRNMGMNCANENL